MIGTSDSTCFMEPGNNPVPISLEPGLFSPAKSLPNPGIANRTTVAFENFYRNTGTSGKLRACLKTDYGLNLEPGEASFSMQLEQTIQESSNKKGGKE